jgi:hypothetical protein
MEHLVRPGEASWISSVQVVSRSGQRAVANQVAEIQAPTAYTRQTDGRMLAEYAPLNLGHQIEIDPVIGVGGSLLDLNVALELHAALGDPVPFTLHPFAEESVLKGLTYPVRGAEVVNSLSLRSGLPRIHSLWSPSPTDGTDRLRIGFLIPEIAFQVPEENQDLAIWIRNHGEKVVPLPADTGEKALDETSPREEGKVAENLFTQVFRVPLSFLSAGSQRDGSQSDDPFADLGPSSLPVPAGTAQEILETVGVTFPPGSSAIYNRTTGQLLVRNTRENPYLVEAFTSGLGPHPPRILRFLLTIAEGPAEELRTLAAEARGLADHTTIWDTLAQQARRADGKTTIPVTALLEAGSGQLAKIEFGDRCAYFLPVTARNSKGKRA